jgi:hypothetical protein
MSGCRKPHGPIDQEVRARFRDQLQGAAERRRDHHLERENESMRFMMIVKASAESEAGVMPTERELAEMTEYNEALGSAGMLVAGEGLHPSSRGARVDFSGGVPTVTDGPFAETKELIAGFWIIEAASYEDALAWAKRVPFREGQVELRKIFEAADFGEALTPELYAREEALREQSAAQHG